VKFHFSSGIPRRVYLSGGWGYGNRGDNAILYSTLASLREAFPDVQLTVASYSCDELEATNSISSVSSIHSALVGPLGAINRLRVSLWRLSNGRIRLPSAIARHQNYIRQSDLVLLAGGGYFNGDWKSMKYAQYLTIELAEKCAVPVAITGQTLGPFHKDDIKGPLGKHLRMCAMVACRDSMSIEIAAEAGVDPSKLRLTADQANLVPIIGQKRSSNSKPVIGLMVQGFRSYTGKYGKTGNPTVSKENYYSIIREALENFRPGREIIIRVIPSTVWDEAKQFSFAESLEKSGFTVEVAKVNTAEAYIAACQSVDIMLSTNMHPAILAASAGIPIVALTYTFKLDEYMKQIGQDTFVVKIDDFDSVTLTSLLNSALDSTATIAQSILAAREDVKARAKGNMKAVHEILS
jgi:polysaccharide pyruvyl transferase WcaK-like protein